MKRYCFFLLTMCLISGAGFPLFAQGNSGRFVIVDRQYTEEVLNMSNSQNAIRSDSQYANRTDSQYTVRTDSQNAIRTDSQNTVRNDFQNAEESLETEKSQKKKELQSAEVLRKTEDIRNAESFRNAELRQNRNIPENENNTQDSTRIKMSGNRLIIENLLNDGLLEIYNIMGVKVYNRRIKSGTNQYVLSLPKGYYIVKIGKLTRKVAVK